jgi:hypothetical protein
MTDFNSKPEVAAEKVLHELFSALEVQADAGMARLHLENRLRQGRPGLGVRLGFRLAAAMAALVLLAGWAVNLPLPGWEDGQQISIQLPDGFTPAEYPHWVARIAKHSNSLARHGGHSLVVDYRIDDEAGYVLQLSILGINYSEANEWTRDMIASVPELQHRPYAITQPLLSYQASIREMLAFKLGATRSVQRNVIRAWRTSGEGPTRNGMIYLIAQPEDYAHRVSMVEY